MCKPYFKKVKEGDKIFGLVFGKGVIRNVWGNSEKDCHYCFEAEFQNGQCVPYTLEGIPGWSCGKLDFQTIFYEKDINLMEYDISPAYDKINPKKFIKLREEKKLEVKYPSGVWINLEICENKNIVEEYLEEGRMHMFRKKKK